MDKRLISIYLCGLAFATFTVYILLGGSLYRLIMILDSALLIGLFAVLPEDSRTKLAHHKLGFILVVALLFSTGILGYLALLIYDFTQLSPFTGLLALDMGSLAILETGYVLGLAFFWELRQSQAGKALIS